MLKRFLYGAAFAIASLFAIECSDAQLFSGTGIASVPSAPTGLAAVTGSSGAINTSWSANAGGDAVTAYKLFRATGASQACSSTSLINNANVLSFGDTGLTPNGAYTYCLKATNIVGDSAFSASVNGTAGGSNQLIALLAATTSGNWAVASTQVPTNSTVSAVYWVCSSSCSPFATNASIDANEHQQAIPADWGGGVYDATNDQMCVTGGGHAGYWGDEVYCQSMVTLQWSLTKAPFDITGYTSGGVLPLSGAPRAGHTYDALAFIPTTTQMMEAGIAGCETNGNSCNVSFVFDTATKNWTQKAGDSHLSGAGAGDNMLVANPVDGNLYVVITGGGVLKYTVASNTWTQLNANNPQDYHMTGAVDSSGNMVIVGGGFFERVNLTTGVITDLSGSTTGDKTCQNANAPGVDWDSHANIFTCWQGGTTLYTISAGNAWTAHTAGGTAPPCAGYECVSGQQSNGTFGRFRYLPAYNAYIVVNTTTDATGFWKSNL